jgi:hypothetical protein
MYTEGDTQMRVTFSSEIVAAYAEAMRRGDEFPPVDVYFDGSEYWLADGFYRVSAARKVGMSAIMAEVHTGTKRDALLHAVGANETHGVRRTNLDKRKAVQTLLADKEWREWSDREIARQTRTSQPFVTKLRHGYLQTLSDSAAGTEGTEARKVRRGESTYTMDTGRIGGAPERRPQKTTAPAAPVRRTDTAAAAVRPPSVPPVPSPAAASSQRASDAAKMPPEPTPAATTTPGHPLIDAWEWASEGERQVFVTKYRSVLLELLGVSQPQGIAVVSVHPESQTGVIVQALMTASAPLSQDELGKMPGVERRRLGRNLSRLVAGGKVRKVTGDRFAVVK